MTKTPTSPKTIAEAHAAPAAFWDAETPPDMVFYQCRALVSSLGVDWLADLTDANRKHIERCLANGLAPKVPAELVDEAYTKLRCLELGIDEDELAPIAEARLAEDARAVHAAPGRTPKDSP